MNILTEYIKKKQADGVNINYTLKTLGLRYANYRKTYAKKATDDLPSGLVDLVKKLNKGK